MKKYPSNFTFIAKRNTNCFIHGINAINPKTCPIPSPPPPPGLTATLVPEDFIAATQVRVSGDADDDYTVDWGDGSPITYAAGTSDSVVPTGNIIVRGTENSEYFVIFTDTITSCAITGASSLQSLSRSFQNLTKLTSFAVDDLSGVTNWTEAWDGCTGLLSFPAVDSSSASTSFFGTWQNCSAMTTFGFLTLRTDIPVTLINTWLGCTSLTSFPLIDTSAVRDFNSAWQGCTGLTSFPLIDTSSATILIETWRDCNSLTGTFPAIDTSGVINFFQTWHSCLALTGFPLIDVSATTTLISTWENCRGLLAFPLTDCSTVTDFNETWRDCRALTSFPLCDVSAGLNFVGTWRFCEALTSFPLLDMAAGTSFSQTWNGCLEIAGAFPAINFSSGSDFDSTFKALTKITSIGSLATEGGIDFDNMFQGDGLLVTIAAIDTTSTTSTSLNMFSGCGSLVSPNSGEQTDLADSNGADFN